MKSSDNILKDARVTSSKSSTASLKDCTYTNNTKESRESLLQLRMKLKQNKVFTMCRNSNCAENGGGCISTYSVTCRDTICDSYCILTSRFFDDCTTLAK